MTRQELRAYIKDKFKKMGYQSYKSYFYKIYDDDYLVGFYLEPSTYVKGYSFIYGIIYLPDELKIPFRGLFDLDGSFRFPCDPDEELDLTTYLENPKLSHIFEYEEYTLEQLDKLFEINYEYFMVPLLDKEHGLDQFRDPTKWFIFRRFAPQNVLKICQKAGIDSEKVFRYLE